MVNFRKIKIRKAFTGEMKQIITIIAKFPEQLIQKPLPKPKDFFVAVDGRMIVGCVALDVYSKKIAEIRSLAVLIKYRRAGIGSRLVKACVKKAQERKIHEILVITENEKLFHAAGFKPFQKQKLALFRLT